MNCCLLQGAHKPSPVVQGCVREPQYPKEVLNPILCVWGGGESRCHQKHRNRPERQSEDYRMVLTSRLKKIPSEFETSFEFT